MTRVLYLLSLILLCSVRAAVLEMSQATGTPLLVQPEVPFGDPSGSRLQNLKQFVEEYYGNIKLSHARDLPKIADSPYDVVTFGQTYKGIHVRGAEIKVVFEGARIVKASSKLVAGLSLDVNPTITEKMARAKSVWVATLLVGPDPRITSAELIVYRKGMSEGYVGANLLAWDVRVAPASNTGSKYSIVIDAHTGDVVKQTPQTYEGLYRELRKWPSTNDFWKEGDTDWPTDYDATSFLNAAGDYYNTLFNMFQWRSFDNRDSPLIANLYMTDKNVCPNAYFEPEDNMTYFCTGLSRFDIATHELGHALTSCLDNGIYEYASGALQEAWSDTIAETFSQFWNGSGYYPARNLNRACIVPGPNSTDSKRWICGDDCALFNYGLRDLYNPDCYGLPSHMDDLYCYPYDNEGVHKNCGPPSVLYAILSDGGVFDNNSFTGIGLLRAWHIFFQTKYYYQTSTETFSEYATHLGHGCQDLVDNQTDLVDQWGHKTGIVVRQEDCDTLSSLVTAIGMDQPPCTKYVLWGAYPSFIPKNGTVNVMFITSGSPNSTEFLRLGGKTYSGTVKFWNPYNSTSGWNQEVAFAIPAFADLDESDPNNVTYQLAADTDFLDIPASDATYSLKRSFVFFDMPVVKNVMPFEGSHSGGYKVTVGGTNFKNFPGPCTPYNRYNTQDCLMCVWTQEGSEPYIDFGEFKNSENVKCVAPQRDGKWLVSLTMNGKDLTNGVQFEFFNDDWPSTQNIIILSVVCGVVGIIAIGLIAGFGYYKYRKHQEKSYQKI